MNESFKLPAISPRISGARNDAELGIFKEPNDLSFDQEAVPAFTYRGKVYDTSNKLDKSILKQRDALKKKEVRNYKSLFKSSKRFKNLNCIYRQMYCPRYHVRHHILV